ncbi:Uncharacterized protein BP5553_00799 [Venustampulla echinocandica]|uniref:RRM domain-containing protein n=1 Tax=Venustampulla echinocandica TaxID=2656787 RepID=A0A370TZ76_9HELO|nr:Uncharacterized protein BP5553_00799 [Venustampulla echinocandica]RDL40820.1 Uncharacterized protein BP5553_00799 [Venustampulla echinocandica]
MNSIRQIQELNKRELENNVSPDASWHVDYRDTAYIYIGGLPFELSEGDVIAIFSQFGEPTYINLVRDKETGKSRGFAFLKYEDQRSTDLAVDNLGGAVVMGRTLRVDHTRYKKKDDEPDEGIDLGETLQQSDDDGEGRRKRRRTSESESEEERPMIKEEIELEKLIREHDEDDPMKPFLIEEKKEEVALALALVKPKSGKSSEPKHRRHHRSRRSRKEGEESGDDDDKKRSRHRRKHRSRSRERSHADGAHRDEKPSRHRRREDEGSRPRKKSPSPARERRRRDDGHKDREQRRRSRSRSIDGPVERGSRYARRRNSDD